MSSLVDGDIFQIGIYLFELVSERTYHKAKKIIFYRAFNIIVLIFTMLFTFANFLHVGISGYVKTLESLMILNHTLLKYSLIIYYKEDRERLLKDRSKFWNYKNYNEDFCRSIRSLYRMVNLGQIAVVSLATAAVSLYLVKPYFNEESLFLLEAWAFTDSFIVDTLILASHYYIFGILVQIVMGYDTFYLALCVDVILQVQLLKRKLRTLSFEEVTSVDEIKLCIKHNQFLISVFARMNKMFSLWMLFLYIATLIDATADLYAFLLGDSNLNTTFIALLSLMFWSSQFAYYSILADKVAFEFSDVSDAIYMSQWYNADPGIQKIVLFVITNTQNIQYFSGVGFLSLNVGALGSVARKTFSFYTVLRKMLNN